ncbi:helix-turn-helix transcriptional regulator [Bhargavaea ullalensis]|uniref:DNA-binding transcriptional regulator YafY n=1 Tax=Bhargavaea ullalensis TaxID=1265685 RepID=A0ABV2G9F9_9BACL
MQANDGKTKLNSRERLLKVVHLLMEETDERHPLTIHEIHARFDGLGVSLKALREDVQALEESDDFPVAAVQEKEGTVKQYFFDGRRFRVHELRLLLDAISAAKFIPEQLTQSLLGKIRKLTSRPLADQLNNELHVAADSADVTDTAAAVQTLHEAVQNRLRIAFKYGRYTPDLDFRLSRDGGDYVVEPYGLAWNNDKYYLIAYFPEKEEIRQYRVDRMRGIRLAGGDFVADPGFSLQAYLGSAFHMYSGEAISLEARFENRLINVVVDRYGTSANIRRDGEGHFILKTQAAMSDGLVRWLLGWGAGVSVLHPPQLTGRMREEIKRMNELYR